MLQLKNTNRAILCPLKRIDDKHKFFKDNRFVIAIIRCLVFAVFANAQSAEAIRKAVSMPGLLCRLAKTDKKIFPLIRNRVSIC
jgi:hypothetical protein